MSVPDLGELRRGVIERRALRPKGPEVVRVEDVEGPGGVRLRHYFPAEERRPLVVFLHGGAFVICDLDSHDRLCRRIAVACGVEVLAVDYRLAPEHPYPAAIDDAVAVLRWARPVGVAGDSAGGYLATMACLRLWDAGEAVPAVQILMCPNTDLTLSGGSVREKGAGYSLDADFLEWAVRQWVPDDGLRGDPVVSPLRVPDLRGMPATVLVTAEHDALRDEGDAYAERLAEAGVRVLHRRELGLEHGFVQNNDPDSNAATDRLLTDAHTLLSEALNPHP
ncbi:alpha/beta hydrolase [Nonomuraea sediminis]|uniref:alpha/beta hydrolase n=1 Tax=Nonomuraea sediminis TaxID=2835864 RepID=UPI00202A5149|nr:alpha/beta hydrolase [Nonomuraea sediminis]